MTDQLLNLKKKIDWRENNVDIFMIRIYIKGSKNHHHQSGHRLTRMSDEVK